MKRGHRKAKAKARNLVYSVSRQGSRSHLSAPPDLDPESAPTPPLSSTATGDSGSNLRSLPVVSTSPTVVTQLQPIVIAPSPTPPDSERIGPPPRSSSQLFNDPQIERPINAITTSLPSGSARLPSNVSLNPVTNILTNNQNATYNYGRDVVNNNSVKNSTRNYFYLTKDEWQENILKEIKTVIGNRFVPAALHDTQSDESGCMAGTRVRILSMFLEWSKNDPMRIFWLSGLAGTGKTSIAVTLCRMLQDEPDVLLGGTFFCSRTANLKERTDARCILPTLAASFAARSDEFAAALKEQLDIDPIAVSKPISAQIGALFQRPLSALRSWAVPIIFVVDALDECSDESEVKKFLQVISTLQCDAKVRFIVTSRPETHISTSPISSSGHNSILRLHTIDTAEVTEDIRTYIANTFSKQPLEDVWYTESDVNLLASRAEGLFIFASTVVAYVLDTDSLHDRKKRLQTAAFSMKNSQVATGPLDVMYEFVITRASNSTKVEPWQLEATRKVLACILAARMPLSVSVLAALLEEKPDTLLASLRHLRAVVHLPDKSEQPGLRTVHASFGDFLFERAPVGLRISASYGDDTLARGCLRIMGKRLHFNISQSRSSHAPNSSVKPESVTLSLEYACLQWVYHLAGLPQPGSMDNDIEENFRHLFLFWLEVMSVLGRVQRATAMLAIAIAEVRSPELRRFLRNANGFVASSRQAIERSAPHIYLSALPFASRNSRVYSEFVPLCTGIASARLSGIDRHGEGLTMTLTGHTGSVCSVAYAPDGRLISGSYDCTVRIWDTRTGEETTSPLVSDDSWVSTVTVAPTGTCIAAGTRAGVVFIWDLEALRQLPRRSVGHSGWVRSVVVSPCGRRIASASSDKTVRLWRADTGKQIAMMGQHTQGVETVAFSPDGEILASGSHDQTVRLWRPFTSKPAEVRVLDQDSSVISVCFSPDGTKLAVGLEEPIIRIWEISTRSYIATLHGHSYRVLSVRFSRDGSSLASTSGGGIIGLWALHETAHDYSLVTEFRHSGCNFAAISPDGLYIASASSEGNIQIRDPGNYSQAARRLPAHKNGVQSVAISADGASIVSGSADGSVRIWDTRTGEPKCSPLIASAGSVESVAISPDARLIASAPERGSVRVWNVRTGVEVGESIRQYMGDARLVTFSSDGRWLAVGLDDGTVRIWDVAVGQLSSIGALRCKGRAFAVAFSPDGQLFAAGNSGRNIRIWSTDTGQLVRELHQETKHHTAAFQIAFSPTGARVAYGGGAIGYVWDIATEQQTLRLAGHDGSVCALSFASNDLRICTGSNDLTVRLWNAVTGAQLVVLHGHMHWVTSVTFTPDGSSVISCSMDSTIRVWDVEAACTRSLKSENPSAVLESVGLNDGWLLGQSGELLLWVPEDYRAYLDLPSCKLLIATHRVSINTAETWHHGTNWMTCWRGSPSA